MFILCHSVMASQHAYIMVKHQYVTAVIKPLHQSSMPLSEINQHPSSHLELSIHGGYGMKV